MSPSANTILDISWPSKGYYVDGSALQKILCTNHLYLRPLHEIHEMTTHGSYSDEKNMRMKEGLEFLNVNVQVHMQII